MTPTSGTETGETELRSTTYGPAELAGSCRGHRVYASFFGILDPPSGASMGCSACIAAEARLSAAGRRLAVERRHLVVWTGLGPAGRTDDGDVSAEAAELRADASSGPRRCGRVVPSESSGEGDDDGRTFKVCSDESLAGSCSGTLGTECGPCSIGCTSPGHPAVQSPETVAKDRPDRTCWRQPDTGA